MREPTSAYAGVIHDVFAEYEEMFAACTEQEDTSPSSGARLPRRSFGSRDGGLVHEPTDGDVDDGMLVRTPRKWERRPLRSLCSGSEAY